ncbi:MAG: F-type H+-transporting ATPase subunit b [Planctomycetota bacterium]|jgi:F-type H+-transporting ATPase subunit b
MLSTIALLSSEGGGFNPIAFDGLSGLLWTVIIFVGALAPIWIMVMGPISRALLARDEEASRAISIAEKASSEAEAARAEVEVKLGEARSEAAKLMSAARERAEDREREIVAAAKTEATNMLDTAREAIRAEQDKAVAAIRQEVVDLTFTAAEQVLGRSVDDTDNRRMVGELVGSTGADA